MIAENIDNLSPEEFLAPPKYDAIGIFMIFLTSLIIGVITGIMVVLLAYLAIGKFSLESGASPILLVFITFISLTVGNLLYYSISSRIFPHIFPRGRTALSQIMAMSIVLYILFIPLYLLIASISTETATILIAFSAHIILNNFTLTLIIGLVSQYRYSILTLYASVISLIITSGIIITIETRISNSNSTKALFILLGLTIVTYVLSSTISSLIAWIYYRIYEMTGADPIGAILSRVESDERDIEKQATERLTQFHPKK